jgi:hypothetical protein
MGCLKTSAPASERVEHLYTVPDRARQDVESIAARSWHAHCSPLKSPGLVRGAAMAQTTRDGLYLLGLALLLAATMLPGIA